MGTMGWAEIAGNTRESFRTVNPYFLESLVRLSDEMELVACSDIVDEHGIKLLARGDAVSTLFQEKMLQRCRLLIPLEVSVDCADGVSLESVVHDCDELVAINPALELLGGKKGAYGVLRELRKMPMPVPLKLLLTAAKAHRKQQYDSSLARMIICSGLADGLGLNDRDAVLLLLSALVCDIGEMYISPTYLDGRLQVQPEAWKDVALHPRIGQAFLNEFTNFPPAIADNVLQHHERQDGSGYPLHVSGANISALTRLIGFADSVSAIIMRGEFERNATHAAHYSGLCARVEIALRIVPDEFPSSAAAFINQALARLGDAGAPAISGKFAERVLPTLQQIRAARLKAEALFSARPSHLLVSVGGFALEAIHRIDKSLRAINLYEFSQLVVLESDPVSMGKTFLVLDEVAWRLRNLARIVYLRIEQGGDASELLQVAELVAELNVRR